MKILKHICGFEVPVDDPTLTRFHAWSKALFERPSIQQTALFDTHSESILAVRRVDQSPALIFYLQMSEIFVDNEALADRLQIPRFPSFSTTAVRSVGAAPS